MSGSVFTSVTGPYSARCAPSNPLFFFALRPLCFTFTILTSLQLLGSKRVYPDVGSVAIKSAVFPGWTVGMTPRTNAQELPRSATAYESLTDAEIMLRAGAGDDSAFDYLVEKFR